MFSATWRNHPFPFDFCYSYLIDAPLGQEIPTPPTLTAFQLFSISIFRNCPVLFWVRFLYADPACVPELLESSWAALCPSLVLDNSQSFPQLFLLFHFLSPQLLKSQLLVYKAFLLYFTSLPNSYHFASLCIIWVFSSALYSSSLTLCSTTFILLNHPFLSSFIKV